MATVPHVTSGLRLKKFQADGFLLTRVYMSTLRTSPFRVFNIRNLTYFVFMVIFCDNSESSSAKLRIIKFFYSSLILSHARLKCNYITVSKYCHFVLTRHLEHTQYLCSRRFILFKGESYKPFAVAQWLRHYATDRQVAGSIPDGVIGIFQWHNPSGRTMALGSTQPLIEMSTRCISWGKGGWCVRLTTLPISCAVVTKSGNLNFLEPSGPLQACNGTALPLPLQAKCSFSNLTFRSRNFTFKF